MPIVADRDHAGFIPRDGGRRTPGLCANSAGMGASPWCADHLVLFRTARQARPHNRHNGHLCEIQVEEDRSSSLAAGGLGESSGFACAVSC